MNNVYVVVGSLYSYEDDEIVCVCETKAKAERFIAAQKSPGNYYWQEVPFYYSRTLDTWEIK